MKLFLFILFISFVFWGGIHWYTKSLYTKLHNCLIKRDIEEFEKLQSKKTYKLFLSLFKVEYLKLNYAIVNEEDALLKKVRKEFSEIKISKKKKGMIYPLLFQYYLSKENQKECKSLLSKMCEIFPQDQINFMHTIYEINLEKSTKYIDEMKQNLENDTKNKGFLLYLIAKQYQNKHDKTEAIFYYQNALDEVKGTPLEEIVRYELKNCSKN